jgi:hypothetical protein
MAVGHGDDFDTTLGLAKNDKVAVPFPPASPQFGLTAAFQHV